MHRRPRARVGACRRAARSAITIPTNARLHPQPAGVDRPRPRPRALVLPARRLPDWVDIGGRADGRPGRDARRWRRAHERLADVEPGPLPRLKATGSPPRRVAASAGPFATGYWGHPAYRPQPGGRTSCSSPTARGPRLAAPAHADPRAARRQGPAPADLPRRRDGARAAVGRARRPGATASTPTSPTATRPTALSAEGLALSSTTRLDAAADVRRPGLPAGRPAARAAPTRSGRASAPGTGDYLSYGDFPRGRRRRGPCCSCRAAASSARDLAARRAGGRGGDRRVRRPRLVRDDSIGERLRHPPRARRAPPSTSRRCRSTTLDGDGRYSWVKAPRYDGRAMETGPLARVLVGYARWPGRRSSAARTRC